MSAPEDNVTVETRDDTEESERMVIIGTDEIQVHPDLSTTQPCGKRHIVLVQNYRQSQTMANILSLTILAAVELSKNLG